MNYDLINNFSLTRRREPEQKCYIATPAPAKSFGSLRLQLRLRLHNTDLANVFFFDSRSPRAATEMPDLYPGSEENSNSDASVVPSIDSLAMEGFNVLTDKVDFLVRQFDKNTSPRKNC